MLQRNFQPDFAVTPVSDSQDKSEQIQRSNGDLAAAFDTAYAFAKTACEEGDIVAVDLFPNVVKGFSTSSNKSKT